MNVHGGVLSGRITGYWLIDLLACEWVKCEVYSGLAADKSLNIIYPRSRDKG